MPFPFPFPFPLPSSAPPAASGIARYGLGGSKSTAGGVNR